MKMMICKKNKAAMIEQPFCLDGFHLVQANILFNDPPTQILLFPLFFSIALK